jgi:DNA-directed RNA polymerase subunit RPC12/RpoP
MTSRSEPEKETTTARCPQCASELIDRMARHGFSDYVRFLFGHYPFRCRRCGHEFYLPQRGTGDQSI